MEETTTTTTSTAPIETFATSEDMTLEQYASRQGFTPERGAEVVSEVHRGGYWIAAWIYVLCGGDTDRSPSDALSRVRTLLSDRGTPLSVLNSALPANAGAATKLVVAFDLVRRVAGVSPTDVSASWFDTDEALSLLNRASLSGLYDAREAFYTAESAAALFDEFFPAEEGASRPSVAERAARTRDAIKEELPALEERLEMLQTAEGAKKGDIRAAESAVKAAKRRHDTLERQVAVAEDRKPDLFNPPARSTGTNGSTGEESAAPEFFDGMNPDTVRGWEGFFNGWRAKQRGTPGIDAFMRHVLHLLHTFAADDAASDREANASALLELARFAPDAPDTRSKSTPPPKGKRTRAKKGSASASA